MRHLARSILRLIGWRFEGSLPTPARYVALAFPHTSNWDGLLMVLIAMSVGLRMSWMIKSEWFWGPMGPLLRAVGAVSVDRSKTNNVVDQMVAEMQRNARLVLVIPPEGTRHRAERWRSGFYYIALKAGVPVVPGYLDYGRRRCGLGEPITLTGDVGADMDRIRGYYERLQPRAHRPQAVGPIALGEERVS